MCGSGGGAERGASREVGAVGNLFILRIAERQSQREAPPRPSERGQSWNRRSGKGGERREGQAHEAELVEQVPRHRNHDSALRRVERSRRVGLSLSRRRAPFPSTEEQSGTNKAPAAAGARSGRPPAGERGALDGAPGRTTTTGKTSGSPPATARRLAATAGTCRPLE